MGESEELSPSAEPSVGPAVASTNCTAAATTSSIDDAESLALIPSISAVNSKDEEADATVTNATAVTTMHMHTSEKEEEDKESCSNRTAGLLGPGIHLQNKIRVAAIDSHAKSNQEPDSEAKAIAEHYQDKATDSIMHTDSIASTTSQGGVTNASLGASTSSQPGAYAVVHQARGDRRAVPPASGNNVVSSATSNTSVRTTATSTETQEELFRQVQAQEQDQEPPSMQVVVETGTTSAAVQEIVEALLVSDPPKGFDNCQICMTACDSGKGWQACKDQCVPDATFSCHNDTLGSMKTVQEYADFIALFGKACPNATWTTHDVFWDGTTHTAFFHCTYHVTHTVAVPGLGPQTPTCKSSNANYCYIIKTDPNRDGKITHVQKLWNDTWLLRDLGWIGGEDDNDKSSSKADGTKEQDQQPAALVESSTDGSTCYAKERGQQQHTKRSKRRVWGRLRKALGMPSSSFTKNKRSCSTTDTTRLSLS
ncbi:expressed unknown protein [Seminavis robusta]|uniref:Uncharacterized protein n=1 Tax=Seminavis robusta TaxID=568900 RepID=A0A9N8DPQ7_9STRA|nr:expressed unknown protein [Seminavis robusta]|eukprot:Sro259_g101270.1 n/a (482) ;mRNA; f:18979-20424